MQELENPIWAALTSAQAHFSTEAGAAGPGRRYPADVAPFLAVAEEGVPLSAADLEGLGDGYYVLDVFPALPHGWALQPLSNVLQMVYDGGPVAALAGDGGAAAAGSIVDAGERTIRELAADDPAMVELTNIAFPGYFRRNTGRMGRYVGIHHGSQLISMSGERMDLGALREVSAVCTHPGHTGKGLARMLMLDCMRHMQQQRVRPFLHVGAANKRAQALYEALGFKPTRELKHAKVISPSR